MSSSSNPRGGGSSYRQQAPAAIVTTTEGPDDDYDYSAAMKGTSYEGTYKRKEILSRSSSRYKSPPKPEDPPAASPRRNTTTNSETTTNLLEDPLVDLEQLEELHEEADRMKALGNKHMASQEFSRAYNAYSAALQLSPVGPSSHVFLCNRAAALLSLKRYAAAATDARRAIALAPTFGKAHARLGQSLYFLKDYEGAVAAYEEAVGFEPDNAVTRTYLEKAKSKLARQHEKARRAAKGDEVSVTEDSVAPTVANSIATDPHRSAAVVSSSARNNQSALAAAAARHALPNEVRTGVTTSLPSPLGEEDADGEFEDDPDFDEAVRIQEHANKLLAAKQYKEAIESYSAALFLVPDDPYLSPELHLGRAHALNGSYRHESAKNDAMLAIKINPTSEAYSTLAKSLFYLKDYLGAVAAFEDCMDLLPQGESLSMFDQAYLRKAEAAWQEELEANPDEAKSVPSSRTSSSNIPKLPPPRFVPREKAINSSLSMPPMPKQWPQQLPSTPTALKVGPERNVTFLSEALGVKLNRGNDGIVRVLSVSPETPSSKVARSGSIEAGDIVREAAGVDIRRPITNIMWGDTIALIKIAPRPITLVVAKELSEPPPSVLEERGRALAEENMSPASIATSRGESKEDEEYYNEDGRSGYAMAPSPAVGEESVKDSLAMAKTKVAHTSAGAVGPSGHVSESSVGTSLESTPSSTYANVNSLDHSQRGEDMAEMPDPPDLATSSETVSCQDEGDSCREDVKLEENESGRSAESEGGAASQERENKRLSTNDKNAVHGEVDAEDENEVIGEIGAQNSSVDAGEDDFVVVDNPTPQDRERDAIGAEILFEREADSLSDWSNLRWLSTSGERDLRFCKVVSRTQVERKGLFRSSGEKLVRRKIAIYEKPNLILLLRPPTSIAEVRKLLLLPDGVALEDERNALRSFLVAESVIDPITCVLRLSRLTTVTSVGNSAGNNSTSRRLSCLELVTPTETISLSALSPDQENAVMNNRALAGGPAFLETASLENAIANALYHAHTPHADPDGVADVAWKHQVVQGTLLSYVLSGNSAMLEKAIKAAVGVDLALDGATKYVPAKVIDAQDESGRTALHYACLRRASQAVSLLIKAGASCTIPVNPGGFFPSHLSALVHDDNSLSVILSATYPSRSDPNQLDALGRTPMYLAAVEGRRPTVGENDVEADSLGRCLSALEAWGGQLLPSDGPVVLRNPVSVLSSRWAKEEVSTVLAHVPFRYPLRTSSLSSSNEGKSLGASFQYPLHSALVTLHERIKMIEKDEVNCFFVDDRYPESALVGTLRVLLEHGFEANGRLEGVSEDFDGAADLIEFAGFTPLQILSVAALDSGSLGEAAGAALKQSIAKMLAGAAELLVRFGARMSVDAPPLVRPRRSDSNVSDNSDASISRRQACRDGLKIDGNGTLMKLLGGKDRLYEAKNQWSQIKSVEATDKVVLHKEAAKASIEDSEAPGGNDEKSCAICWKEFGALVNRRHKCRVSMRFVCDDCSSKRISDGRQEHRVSDGQFCLAQVDAAREAAEDHAREREESRARLEKARASRQPPKPSDEGNRSSLFGSVMDKAASLVLGEEDAAELTGRQVDGLATTMNQTRDALNERGEKLNSLGEKTAQLASSSHEFAKMARELERAQRGGLFW